MAGGLDNLSNDGLRQLSNTINEAKELLNQQEALLRQTLAMEQQIVTRRVAGLKEYNDEYSRLLNSIAAEQASLSAEMFKINEAGKEAAENAEKAAESAKQARETESKNASSGDTRARNQTISDEAAGLLGSYSTSKNIAYRLSKHKELDSQILATIKKEKDAVISIEQLKDARWAARKRSADEYAESEVKLEETLTELAVARLQEKTDKENQIRAVQISHMQEMAEAELSVQNLRNEMLAELTYSGNDDDAAIDAGNTRARFIHAQEEEAALNALREQMDKERLELEFQARLANNNELTAQDEANINKQLAAKYSNEVAIQKWIADYKKEQFEEEIKRREKEERKARKEEEANLKRRKDEIDKTIADATSLSNFSKENNLKSKFQELNNLANGYYDENGDFVEGIGPAAVLIKALSSLAQQLGGQMDEIASSKGAVDTRLHGSSNEKWAGSYWDQIVHDMTRVGAINPFFKQEAFASKIKDLVDAGIAFDLEQRAFLATISDKIATTFNATDATLLRLVRIQQEDSTAGRLGMEASINAFLNNMYENTEYLKGVADSVRGSLEEMQSLMSGAEATEVEYQVQKWMGSLYSVGMSRGAVDSISQALGQIAAGQIDGLTGDGAGNLLIMAASDAGLSIADILTKGLDSSDTNKLMQAVVNYLAEIADASQDNQVVQQQLANVFGVKASDLRAATNLATKGSVNTIFSESMSYDNMLYYLHDMAGSMAARTSLGEMMTNVWDNLQYSLAGGMASNPLSYFLYKTATLLDNTTGGGQIPDILGFGTGVMLHTTLSDLIRVGALGTGILGSLGSLVQGLGNSLNGRFMLNTLGISTGTGLAITPRGDGSLLASVGGGEKTTSASGYVGNASGSDIKNSTLQEAEDTKKQVMVEAQEDAEATQIDSINTTVLKIYELLDDVAHGNSYFRVKVEGYGLTKAGSSSGSLGGVGALDNLTTSSNYSTSGSGSGSGSLSRGGVNSGVIGGSINFGGWTTVI